MIRQGAGECVLAPWGEAFKGGPLGGPPVSTTVPLDVNVVE